MVALIDTNVILNYITDREDRFRDSSKAVMDLCSQGKVDGYFDLSWHKGATELTVTLGAS